MHLCVCVCAHVLMICPVAPLRAQCPFLRMSPDVEVCVC